MADEFLVYDSGVDPFDIQKGLMKGRKDPTLSSPDDVTDSLVQIIKHPDKDLYASPISDVELLIRNPNPPNVRGFELPDKAQGKGSPNADFWHQRLDIEQWGTIKSRSTLEDNGWFPNQQN